MKKIVLTTLTALSISLSTFAQSTVWNLDKTHTSIGFSVTHLVVSEATGSFKKFDGTVKSDKPDFSDAKIEFTADVNSINTDNEMRDNHLKSDDFFNAEKFPQIKFVSKELKANGKNKYKLTGDLTVRDITKKVTFDLTYKGTVKDPYGNTKAGFKATGMMKRDEFGLKYNAMAEAGAVVGNEVELIINVELSRAK